MQSTAENINGTVVNIIPPELCLQSISLGLVAQLLPEQSEQSPEAQFLEQYRVGFQHIEQNNNWLETIISYLKKPNKDDKTLVELATELKLTTIELLVVSLAMNIEFNAMLGRAVAYLQQPLGGSRPTLGLLDIMLHPLIVNDDSGRNNNIIIKQLASGLAFQTGLFQLINTSAPLPEQAVQVPISLALALTDSQYQWPGAELFVAPSNNYELPESIINAAIQHAAGLNVLDHSALVIHSGSMNEAQSLANIIAGELDKTALLINDSQKALQGLGPLCICQNLIPVFIFDMAPSEQKVLPVIEGYKGPVLVISGPDGNIESPNGSISHWQAPYPTVEERQKLWMHYIEDEQVAEKLAIEHVHTVSRIAELSKLAIREATSNNKESFTIDDVRQVSWMSEGGLSALAEPIKSRVYDDALVVRKQTLKELQLFEKRCRLREHLVDDLGVTFKARYQMGVKGLFIGPSGTGKTLASSWLATHLGLPLYRVDLASVTSKYIGETEKNLARLLAQAEQDEVILLFDEADSMFGKRTDVKDSNDRFANAQTNYLLQRIESYKGIVILTSNSKARFDDAFTRRLDMMIEFPQPEPKERRSIWLSHLGGHHSLTAKEINQLSVTSDLCGGHIRNAVLSATVYAKSNNELVSMKCLIQGLQGEYKKLGKQLSPELKQYLDENVNLRT